MKIIRIYFWRAIAKPLLECLVAGLALLYFGFLASFGWIAAPFDNTLPTPLRALALVLYWAPLLVGTLVYLHRQWSLLKDERPQP